MRDNFAEKREYRRISVACKISFVSSERQLVFNSHTENISAGGIMVIIEENAPSTIVDLELYLWDKEQPLKCKGEIVWVNEITPKETKPRLFNTGIKFIEMSDFDKEEIKKFVNTIISTWQ